MYGHVRSQGSASSGSSRGVMNAIGSNGAGIGAGHGQGYKMGNGPYSNAGPSYPHNGNYYQGPNVAPQNAQQRYANGHANGTMNSYPGGQSHDSHVGSERSGGSNAMPERQLSDAGKMTNGVGNSNGTHRSRSRRPDPAEIRRVGRIHYEELLRFLRSHLAKGQRGPRTNAREKLTRLSEQQFTELSTDVYDELMRRINNSRTAEDIPHLAVREEFHPKRNQARQKLATLPRTRFKDLSSDVFFELERRFPDLRSEFRPDALSPEEEAEREEGDAVPVYHERQAPPAVAQSNERNDDPAPAFDSRHRPDSTLSAGSTPQKSFGEAYDRIDIGDTSQQAKDESGLAQPSMTDIVVPAKSSLVEEAIELPPAQLQDSTDSGENTSTSDDAREPEPEPGPKASLDEKRASARDSLMTREGDDVARSTMYSQASSIGTGFLHGYTNGQANTDSMTALSPNPNGRGSLASMQQNAAEVEKIRSEYEFKLATIQHKLSSTEQRNAELERELASQKEESMKTKEAHESQMRALQGDNDNFRSLHDGKEADLQRVLAQLSSLQSKHDELERDRSTNANSVEELEVLRRDNAEQGEVVTELRNEVTNLVEELRQLSSRNDEIINEKESTQTIVRDLNNQVASYKRKYEAAKTELRSLKATSQLFVQQPKPDEEDMTASDQGAIADVSLTAFQSSIDELLASARGKNVSNILSVYRTVVLSATLIMDDLSKHEKNASSISPEEREQYQTAKSKISTALNNLMIACRNHAAGGGLSPVGLVDAAASHVSAAVVDTAKSAKMRKATAEERAEFEATFSQNGTLPNGLKPLHANAFSSHPRETFQSPGSIQEQRRRTGEPSGESERLKAGSQNDPTGSLSPGTRTGTMKGRYSPVGYRPDVIRKGSQGEVSWKAQSPVDRSRNVSSSSSAGFASQYEGKSAAMPSLTAALQRMGPSSHRSVSSSTSASHSPFAAAYSSDIASPMASSFAQAPASSFGLQEQTLHESAVTTDLESTRTAPRVSDAPSSSSNPASAPSFGGDEYGEEHWGEMRNYIEVQTEAIVHCIQALLSSIREGAQGNQLHENLTQITTIVSSIIAISKDNIPRAAAAAAAAHKYGAESAQDSASAAAVCERILQELSDHCEKLIDMQSIGGQFDKTTKSNMASASYGVAKGLKALNGLLNQGGR